MNIIYQSRKFSNYEMQDIFEPEKFISISEDAFNSLVVSFRDQYILKYIKNGQEFIDKYTGFKIRRFYK